MRIKNWVLIILVALIFLFSTAVSAAPVQITWWAPSWTTDVANDIATKFNAVHDDIQVRVEFFPWSGMWEKYQTTLQAGAGPDVLNVAVDWNRPFAAAGYLLDVDDQVSRNLDRTDFYAGSLETAMYDGRLYGIPHQTEAIAMFYNVDYLESAGFSAEKPPQNWREFQLFAERSHVPGRKYSVGLPGSGRDILVSRLAPFIYGNGGSILNDDLSAAVIDSPEAIEAIDFYVSMSTKYGPPGIVSMNNDDLSRLFQGGALGSMITQPGFIETLKMDENSVPFVSAIVPMGAVGTASTLKGWNVVIPASTKNPDEAWKFVEFFLQPDNMARFTVTLPARHAASEHPRFADPHLRSFIEQLQTARANPGIPEWPSIESEIWTQIQDVYLGRATGAEAAQRAKDAINSLLND